MLNCINYLKYYLFVKKLKYYLINDYFKNYLKINFKIIE